MYKLLKWNKNVYSHALFITQVLSYLENLKKIKKIRVEMAYFAGMATFRNSSYYPGYET